MDDMDRRTGKPKFILSREGEKVSDEEHIIYDNKMFDILLRLGKVNENERESFLLESSQYRKYRNDRADK